MIKTHQSVMEELADYASPKARLTHMLRAGSLLKVRRGLFVDDAAVSRRALAPVIYGPSYISFQYALASYGLIPERVETITCASYGKNRDKLFRTPLGEYRYLYLPVAVYPYGISQDEDEGARYLIATPEKALCDAVYKTSGIVSRDELETLLLEDWRVEKEELHGLDADFIEWIAPRYGRRSVSALASWFRAEVA